MKTLDQRIEKMRQQDAKRSMRAYHKEAERAERERWRTLPMRKKIKRTLIGMMLVGGPLLGIGLLSPDSNRTPGQESRELYRVVGLPLKGCANQQPVACEREKRESNVEADEEKRAQEQREGEKRAQEEREE